MATDIREIKAQQGDRKQRAAHLQWVRIGDIVSSLHCQRTFSPAWANALASNFELEGMGYPTLSKRDGVFYCIDGQHRIAALKILEFSDDDTIQVEVYENLTEKDEAELFLERNQSKAVSAGEKFHKGVNAERAEETAIAAVVRQQGLRIGRRDDGAISAVTTLRKVYGRVGIYGLGKTLRIIRDAYGEAGLEAQVIDGLGYCMQRYDGTLDEDTMVKSLAGTAGGLNGLLNQAGKERAATGQPKSQCIAATAINFYNRNSRKKLASWWKE